MLRGYKIDLHIIINFPFPQLQLIPMYYSEMYEKSWPIFQCKRSVVVQMWKRRKYLHPPPQWDQLTIGKLWNIGVIGNIEKLFKSSSSVVLLFWNWRITSIETLNYRSGSFIFISNWPFEMWHLWHGEILFPLRFTLNISWHSARLPIY